MYVLMLLICRYIIMNIFINDLLNNIVCIKNKLIFLTLIKNNFNLINEKTKIKKLQSILLLL